MIKNLFIILFGLLSIKSIDEYEKEKKQQDDYENFYIRKNIRYISYIFLISFFFVRFKDTNLIIAFNVMKPFAILLF